MSRPIVLVEGPEDTAAEEWLTAIDKALRDSGVVRRDAAVLSLEADRP